ncbi:hypothetical protein RCIX2521 [Methanocella arvoryzae MRE50]|uniref:HEPN domain-containing protein n=2 Tax=Methanocella TaxID=570266 RepID=Q0W204_METAR|nr:hypothetical protein RCIX2521 [Methanocella arvoryzae MRE50]
MDDRLMIESAYDNKIYSQALFHAQQLTEKSSKACLAILRVMPKDDHHYSEMVRMFIIPNSKKFRDRFDEYLPLVVKLESQYIPTRYGVTTSGTVRIRKYDEQTVKKECNAAKDYLELCFSFVEDKMSKQLPRSKAELEQVLVTEYKDNVKFF